MSGSISVIAIVRRTFELYVRQASLLLPAAVCLVGVAVVLGGLSSNRAGGLSLLELLVTVAALALFTGVVVQIVVEARDGCSNVSIGVVLRAVRPVFGTLLLVGTVASIAIAVLLFAASFVALALVIGAVVSVGSVTHLSAISGVLVGIVIGMGVFLAPALLLIVNWSVAAPVVVLERPHGLGALARSRALVRHNRWRVLGTLVLLWIPLGIIARMIEAGGVAAGSGPALAAKILLGILIAPIPVIAAVVLYFELLRVAADDVADSGGSPLTSGSTEVM
jgi:hypothetical protein